MKSLTQLRQEKEHLTKLKNKLSEQRAFYEAMKRAEAEQENNQLFDLLEKTINGSEIQAYMKTELLQGLREARYTTGNCDFSQFDA